MASIACTAFPAALPWLRVVDAGLCGRRRAPRAPSIGLYYPSDYASVFADRDRCRGGTATLGPIAVGSARSRRPTHAAGQDARTRVGFGQFPDEYATGGLGRDRGRTRHGERRACVGPRHGVQVHRGTIEDVEFDGGRFDLICAWMTFEHVHDPVDGFRCCWRWLKPGGWLAFSVPDCGSWQFRTFRGQWFALQLPTHLHHFTPAILETILDCVEVSARSAAAAANAD